MTASASEDLKARDTVFVACKVPQGIVIREYEKKTEHENVFGGERATRKVLVHRPTGPKIRIKGPIVPEIYRALVEVVDGYAITANVPKKVFDQWMETNEDSPLVTNHMIFGRADHDSIVSWCKEHSGARSGMEPLDVKMVKNDDGDKVLADARLKAPGLNGVQPFEKD